MSSNYWSWKDHALVSTGEPDAFRPVLLDATGKLDNSVLKTGSSNGLDADTVDGSHAAAFAASAHTHAAYVAVDGTTPLTADWDIGDTRKLIGDAMRARDAAGLRLEDAGAGLGVFVEDGGHVGIGTDTPETLLHLHGTTPSFRISSAAADQNATILWMDNNADLKGRLTYRGANAAGSKYFGFVNDGGDYLRFESTYLRLVGNVMIGNYVAQGPLHVFNATAGLLFATKTAIDGTAQVIIPNGTGDVTRALMANYIAHNGTTTATGTAVLVPGGTMTQAVVCGADTYTLRLNADGSIDVRRTGGTVAGTFAFWGFWM